MPGIKIKSSRLKVHIFHPGKIFQIKNGSVKNKNRFLILIDIEWLKLL
ncbi:hypothetical protein EPYR_00685 [Erwinia pyrifoliae DSM 12163]|nr:hypothetical protein EPYR_00685 [Erwinia pyrifoliae DSM 12163]